MANLYDRLEQQIPRWRDELQDLARNHGDKVISEVTVAQALGGARGVKSMVCDTSEVPPDKGLMIRGTPLAELTDRTAEDIFYLLDHRATCPTMPPVSTCAPSWPDAPWFPTTCGRCWRPCPRTRTPCACSTPPC